ncbi:MAG: DegV family protein [Syntrophomonadaceae bacterium]|jgi:DegV family protein with EDD domain
MATYIITDSTSYLPADFIQHNNIQVIPLNVHLHDRVYKENLDLSNQEYYHLLRTQPIFPSTSQPSTGDFCKVFEQLQPGDEAIVILISSRLSGTVQSAEIAKNILGKPSNIHIIDSYTTTVGMGLMVLEACQLLNSGHDTLSVIERLQDIRERLKLLFVVDNLEYLARGGRISSLAKSIGNILQIKPILHVRDGQIELWDKVRTRQKAVNHILEELNTHLPAVQRVGVTHVDALEEGQSLFKQVKEIFPGEVLFYETGPVIGSHAGPGAVALAFF